MALGVGVPIPTIATAGVRIVPDLSGFGGALRAGGIDQATVGAAGLGTALAGAAAAATALGAASVAAAVKAGNAFTDYEKSLTLIQTLTGTSAEVTEEWGDRLLELAPKVGRGPQELADALFFVASAGLEGEVAFEALEASARGAALGLGDTETVADAVTSAIGAYGVENLNAAEAVDILAAAVDRGKVEADALAGSIGRVLPIASAAGVEFEEVGAAIAALSRTGLDAEEAATALRQLFNNIINPSRESKKALADVGLTAEEMRASLDENLLGTLELVRDRFDGNTDALFNLIPNIRAVTGFLSLMGENADSTRAVFDDLANATGFVDERFQTLAESNAFRRDQAIAAIQAAFIGEGGGSATAVTELLETAAEIIPNILPTVIDIGEQLLVWAEAAANIAASVINPEGDGRSALEVQFDNVAGGEATALEWLSTALYALVDPRAVEAIGLGELSRIVDDFYASILPPGGTFGTGYLDLETPRNDITDLRRGREASAARWSGLAESGFDPTAFLPPDAGEAWAEFQDPIFGAARAYGEAAAAAGEAEAATGGIDTRLIINPWVQLQGSIAAVVAETHNYGEALLELTDPGFNAISQLQDFREAYADAVDPESDGGAAVTDAEALGLAQPFLELNAAIEGLDPGEVTNFREIVGGVLGELGTDFDSVFGEEGVVDISFGKFGEVTAQVLGEDGPVLSNIDGWGTRTFGPAVAGELGSALGVVKNALGIDSPSSVWADEVGKPIAQGVAQGFRAGIPEIIAAFGEIPDPSTIPGYGGVNVTIVNPNTRDVVDEASVVASTVTAADIIGRGGR